jgi:hypothetical protein
VAQAPAKPDPAAPALRFDAARPADWRAGFHREVVLVPWGENRPGGAKRAAGLYDAAGRFLPEGHCWRYAHSPITVPPVPPLIAPGTAERLSGRWLFGGLFYGHFGHFLVETTTRLWAVPRLPDLRGIVFYPKQRLTHERRQFRHMLPFFDALGLGGLEIRAPQAPTVVEALATPPPGFGMAEMMAGTPDYRAFIRDNLGRDLPRDGPTDVYVSRSRLTAKRGSILLESAIEAAMAAAGYRVVHPQEHDLAGQVRIWRSARRLVAADGSALHLAAMVARPDARVAILNRGPSTNIEDYIRQFRSFAGIDPLRIEAVRGYYHRDDQPVVKRETHAVLDFGAVGAALRAGGFLTPESPFPVPSAADFAAEAEGLAAAFGTGMAYHDAE